LHLAWFGALRFRYSPPQQTVAAMKRALAVACFGGLLCLSLAEAPQKDPAKLKMVSKEKDVGAVVHAVRQQTMACFKTHPQQFRTCMDAYCNKWCGHDAKSLSCRRSCRGRSGALYQMFASLHKATDLAFQHAQDASGKQAGPATAHLRGAKGLRTPIKRHQTAALTQKGDVDAAVDESVDGNVHEKEDVSTDAAAEADEEHGNQAAEANADGQALTAQAEVKAMTAEESEDEGSEDDAALDATAEADEDHGDQVAEADAEGQAEATSHKEESADEEEGADQGRAVR